MTDKNVVHMFKDSPVGKLSIKNVNGFGNDVPSDEVLTDELASLLWWHISSSAIKGLAEGLADQTNLDKADLYSLICDWAREKAV